jgi:hypothetical protein
VLSHGIDVQPLTITPNVAAISNRVAVNCHCLVM